MAPPSCGLFGAISVFAQQLRAPRLSSPGGPGAGFLTAPIMDCLSPLQELARGPLRWWWVAGRGLAFGGKNSVQIFLFCSESLN